MVLILMSYFSNKIRMNCLLLARELYARIIVLKRSALK